MKKEQVLRTKMERAGKPLKISAANSREKSILETTKTRLRHDSNATPSQLKRYTLTTHTLHRHNSNDIGD